MQHPAPPHCLTPIFDSVPPFKKFSRCARIIYSIFLFRINVILDQIVFSTGQNEPFITVTLTDPIKSLRMYMELLYATDSQTNLVRQAS